MSMLMRALDKCQVENRQLRELNAELLVALRNLLHACPAMGEPNLDIWKQVAKAAIANAEKLK